MTMTLHAPWRSAALCLALAIGTGAMGVPAAYAQDLDAGMGGDMADPMSAEPPEPPSVSQMPAADAPADGAQGEGSDAAPMGSMMQGNAPDTAPDMPQGTAQDDMPAAARMQTPMAAPMTAMSGAPQPGSMPVVVELFTSQGCAACPPADALLGKLAQRDDVIALSLHVDYWDYLGWEDPFGQPAFTTRQKGYAKASGERMIYTPQMIVSGAHSLVGADTAAVYEALDAAEERRSPVQMSVAGSNGQYQIELRADPPLEGSAVVQIVRYVPSARVEILRGENAGLEIDYANVVTAWHAVADWDGRTPTRLTARIEGNEPAVLIVQGKRPGRSSPLPGAIFAAAELR